MNTQDKLNKKDILSLSINALAKNQAIKECLYSQLLKGVHDNDPFLTTDKENAGDLVSGIMDRMDWNLIAGASYGQDKFFNGTKGLYTSLKEDLKNIYNTEGYKKIDWDKEWENHYWNDSVSDLLKLLYLHINPEGMKDYEKSGLLVESSEEDGVIDLDYLRATIRAAGAKAEMRMIDVENADAGNSFVPEDKMYSYIYDEEEDKTLKVVNNPWVIPWYNLDANTYKKVRGEDKKCSALINEDNLQFTRKK